MGGGEAKKKVPNNGQWEKLTVKLSFKGHTNLLSQWEMEQ
jgi:hypothetical protein